MEASSRNRYLILFMAASLVWHAFLVYIGLGGSLFPNFRLKDRSVLDLELVSRERRWEISRGGGELSGPHTLSGLKGLSGVPFPDRPSHVAVRDLPLEGAMREIKVKVGKLWEAADPPGFGRVRIMLAVGLGGEILSLGLSEESGVDRLDRFLLDMVRSAGPFPDAVRGLGRPLVIELEFTVKPQLGKP